MPLLFSGLLLSACDQISESNCSSEVAHKLIAKNLIENVEKKTASDKYSDTGEFIFDKAKISASLAQLQIAVESVRTTKEDPNSSKKFCSGVLKVTIPTSMLNDADQGRELEHKTKISEYSRELNIDNSINVFTKKDFEFSVQPTDDGKELYVESENGIWVRLLHDITWSALLKPELEEQKIAQNQKNVLEKQQVALLKQEAEASKLEAEKLQALQEKQEVDRIKQELIEKQASTLPEQTKNQTKVPKFKEYPAEKNYTGKNHPLVLDEFGKQFKTRLSDAIKNNKPDFSGHYIVTGWGCGTSGCNTGAVIDTITGRAYPFPVALSSVYPVKPEFGDSNGQEHIYRLNSRLMIFAGNLEGIEQGNGEDTIAFYEFKDGKFILLKAMLYGRKKSE
jgi:hypothetical protein